MRQVIKAEQFHRALSMLLAIVMVASLVPFRVFAASLSAELTTDITEKNLVADTPIEFTVTTTANDNAGAMVRGYIDFSDRTAIEKLEYLEVKDGKWYEMEWEFGPDTGFPLSDATSRFRVTFNKGGKFTANISVKTVEGAETLCSTTAELLVKDIGSVSSDIGSKKFIVDAEPVEFGVTTVANKENVMVYGTFVFSDPSAIKSLEYCESKNGEWYKLSDRFGPEGGFPLTNATSSFRVAFNKAGTYQVQVFIKSIEDDSVICMYSSEVAVKGQVGFAFETDIVEIKFGESNITNTISDSVADAKYTYKSSNENVVTVDENGFLTAVSYSEEPVTITVTREESELATAAEATYTVKVLKGDQEDLQWAQTLPSKLAWTNTDYFNRIVGDTGDGSVTYVSDNTEVAEVDSNGKLTLKKPGTVTITATKAGGANYNDKSASYTLEVIKAAQENLAFEESNPNAIRYGDSFTNKATGGSVVDATIEYISSDTAIATVDSDGKVTAVGVGSVTIIASLAGNDYYEAAETASYDLNIVPAEQTIMFEKGNEDQTIVFGEEYANVVLGGKTKPEYAITNDSSADPEKPTATVDPETGAVKALRAGTVTVTATLPASELYEGAQISYQLVITKATQEVTFEKGVTNIPALTYGESYQNKAEAKTAITYSTSDLTIADVDENGKLTIYAAGTVTITASAAESDQYLGASKEYTITIYKAEQNVSFENGNEDTITVTYNDNGNKFTNTAFSDVTAKENEDNSDIVPEYSIVEGEEFAALDIRTGEVTILGAGTVVIWVDFPENSRYKSNSAKYTLLIKKDNQKITFIDPEIEIINGDKSFISPSAVKDSEFNGDGEITYFIEENNDGVVSGIDSATGALTFTNNIGKVTILAKKAADANYNGHECRYTLTVKDWDTGSDVYYTLEGETVNTNGWFVGNVSVAAKEGYLISYKQAADEAEWKDSLEEAVTGNGTYTVEFYIQNSETGYISGLKKAEIKKDDVVPSAEIIHVNSNEDGLKAWDRFLTIVTLGFWQPEAMPEEMSFIIESSDETSGVGKVEYFIDEGTTELKTKEALDAIEEWKDFNESIKEPKNKIFVVYAKVTDTAGNYTYASTNGVVFDGTGASAGIEVKTEASEGFYNGDVELVINVNDAVPSSGLKNIKYEILNNGEVTQSGELFSYDVSSEEYGEKGPTYAELINTWNSEAAGKNVVVNAEKNNSDSVTVIITVEDNAGNVTTESIDLKICVPEPTLDVEYEDGAASVETFQDVTYYDTARKAIVVINTRDTVFAKSERPVVTVTATDVHGNPVSGDTYEISDWVTAGEGDQATHTLTILFNGNANYEFNVAYIDIFGNECSYASEKFVVDHDMPTAKVTIDENNVWTKFLTTLTFGLWKNNSVTVKAEADDATSPVKSLEYYMSTETTALSKEVLEGVEWKEFKEFFVDKNHKFTIYLKATDRAGNVKYISSDGFVVEAEPGEITISPAEPNANGIYNGDFDVQINVTDNEIYSGIKTVEYWVMNGSAETQYGKLYSFEYIRDPGENSNGGSLKIYENGALVREEEGFVPEHKDLRSSFVTTITVDAELNNSDNIIILVKATDNAGNSWERQTEELRVDITAPKIDIKFDTNDCKQEGERGYFNRNREATIEYTERTSSFNQEKAEAAIVITAIDSKGEPVALDREAMIVWDESIENPDNPDEAKHIAHVYFTTDANYTFTVSYTDEAGNECSYENVTFAEGTVAPKEFTVDKVNPTAKVTIDETNVWTRIVETLSFGLWKNNTVTVKAESDDVTSPVKTLEYYMSDEIEALSQEALEGVEWTAFEAFPVDKDSRFTVYLKATDCAGNVTYISSDGFIVDMQTGSIGIALSEANENGIYSGDFDVQISVNDLEPYSGIKTVEYWVMNGETETQYGKLLSYEYTRDEGENSNTGSLKVYENGALVRDETGILPNHDDLISSFVTTITVDAELNNSDYVTVLVKVTDNAGNSWERQTEELSVDITAPKIAVRFDSNNCNLADDRGYFGKNREAIIEYTERTSSFNQAKAEAAIEFFGKDSNDGDVALDRDAMIVWDESIENPDNPDEAKHIAHVYFTTDANYTFTVSYTDEAGNECPYGNVTFAEGTVAPKEFTVDKTEPTAKVSIDVHVWSMLLEKLTFGLWKNTEVWVKAESDDATSPLIPLEYYVSTGTQALTKEELKDVDWKEFKEFSIDKDSRFTVYLKATDYAGNVKYISSDGFIVDMQMSDIGIDIAEANENGIYNGNFDVQISVNDLEPYSGIKTVEYWVMNGDTETQYGMLYSYEYTRDEGENSNGGTLKIYENGALVRDETGVVPEHKDLRSSFETTVTVDAGLNNSDYVSIHVKVTDNAGNERYEKRDNLRVDITPPKIDVRFDTNDCNLFGDRGYFDKNREAIIEYTERTSSFNQAKAEAAIEFFGKDSSEGDVALDREAMVVWDESIENPDNPDEAKHIAHVYFTTDANYTFTVSYTDEADNECSYENVTFAEGTVAPKEFTVDKVVPEAVIIHTKSNMEGLSTWEKFLTIVTLGFWQPEAMPEEMSFIIESSDEISDVEKVEYFIDEGTTELKTKEELDDIEEWTPFGESIDEPKDNIFVVYAKVTDRSGNYVYASTNGVVFDGTEASAEIEVKTEASAGFHDEDVEVAFKVKDAEPSSGLKSIKYEVWNNGEQTQGDILFSYDVSSEGDAEKGPKYGDLVKEWDSEAEGNHNVIVLAEANNSDFVTVKFIVEDNAGNVTEKTVDLKICVPKPTLDVTYENTAAAIETFKDVTYYNAERTAVIVINTRESVFNASLRPVVTVTATDSKGNSVGSDTYEISDWTTVGEGDQATHTLTIKFNGNANYQFSVAYTDIFGNERTYTSEKFVVDNDAPAAKVIIDESNAWTKIIETLTFGLWKNSTVTVKADADDATSPIRTLEYVVSEKTTALTQEEHSKAQWSTFEQFSVSENKRFTVYLKATDRAGNVTYINSDGYIVDLEEGDILIVPEEPHSNGFYNGSFNVNIAVTDKEPYSGIKRVEYWVLNGGTETKHETLYTYEYSRDSGENSNGGSLVVTELGKQPETFEGKIPAYENLTSRFEKTITVDAGANNSDYVSVRVRVTDNAGNEWSEQIDGLKVDITEPKIDVSFNLNNGYIDGDRGYFNQVREATIVYTERASSFNREKATERIKITGVDGMNQGVELDLNAMITWGTSEINEKDPDNSKHYAHVRFATDANYELTVSYVDEANNECKYEDVTFARDTVTPRFFTVDKTDPVASISIADRTWDKLLLVLSFGLFTDKSISVTSEQSDMTSPIKVEYYKTDKVKALTRTELDNLNASNWMAFGGLEIMPEERVVVYLKVSDYAGNYVYVNSDGYILDNSHAAITLTPDTTEIYHDSIPVYNQNVNVQIDISEMKEETYSGIKSVEYWVKCDGNETHREVLMSFDTIAPTHEDLIHTFSKSVMINASENNSCDVVLYVGVMDNAGNYVEQSLAVDIDISAPTISVHYENDEPYKIEGEKGYYSAKHNAIVEIVERPEHFNAEEATKGILITATDVKGKVVIEETSSLIGAWKTTGSGNSAVHAVEIDFSADANYTFEISYTDLAANSNEEVDTGSSKAPYAFAVDTTAPTGSVTAQGLGTWDKLINILTFGLWSKNTVNVSFTAEDITTPIESVLYYKTSDTTQKTENDLNAVTGWIAAEGLTIPSDERFVVYTKITDYAGNVTYISTNGVIIDDSVPSIESVKPEISITPDPAHGIYHSDVTVGVSVIDPGMGTTNAYTGLKEIRYEVYNLNVKTQEGLLFSFDIEDPTHSQLMQSWNRKDAIVVNKDLNNSNDVKIVVYAVDNAGNTNSAECIIKIDTTAPVIEVSYDKNDGDASFSEGVYFNADRTAKIVVTERNFDPSMVQLVITNTDGYIPQISDWTTVQGTGNGDNTTNTAYVVFNRDGDYTFDVSCVDMADNESVAANYGSSQAPGAFTVDKTAPVVNIVYNNNKFLNGNYYNAERIATITVTEHNFETGRIQVYLKATDNGVETALPVVSEWTSNGDVHTATVTFAADSLYEFDFDYNDKAGNASADLAVQTFYIDTTAPSLSISGIMDESANNAENIGFVMTATDTNFDVFTPVLTAVYVSGESKETTLGEITDTVNGKIFTVENIEEDGIYRITCKVIDKAGNAYTEVILDRADGTQSAEKRSGEDTLATFSVNRDGSAFELDQSIVELVKQYYIQSLDEDIVINEVNVDTTTVEITLDGPDGEKVLEADKDYRIETNGGNGTWSKKTYYVSKTLFDKDGEYILLVNTKDAAGNNDYSDSNEENRIAFVVDTVAPSMLYYGIGNDGRYLTDKQTVELMLSDDGGALGELIYIINDGNPETVSAEAIKANGGKITFDLMEGTNQVVKVTYTDEAGNSKTEEFSNITVTSNRILLLWANEPLRWGVLGGTGAAAFAVVGVVLFRKKRKTNA